MISSEDVRHVTFDRAMRGYRCEDVDDYLKQVADSMDAISASTDELQKKLVVLAQRVEQYRAEEDTLRTTMINAQRLGENVIKEAKQKAAEIIRAANIKAEDREQHARDEVELAQQEVTTLKRETDSFKKNLLEMYRKHIQLLSKIPEYESEGTPAVQAVEEPPISEPEPVQSAAVQQAPVYDKPAPQPEAEEYYEEPAAEVQPPRTAEKKVDTVEFAIAPKPDEPEDLRESIPAPPSADTTLADVSGLYDAPLEKPARKPAARSKAAPRSKSTRKTKTAAPQDPLPSSFDSFAGVDFDS